MSASSLMKPQHIAIIMDGNGRWAERQNLPRMVGHEEGVRALEKVLKSAVQNAVPILTLFAFGIENWRRPDKEVEFLMELFVKNLETHTSDFTENNIRLRVIGDRSNIHAALAEKIAAVEALTAKNTGLLLVIAFNYSGQWDILQATQQISKEVKAGTLTPENISYEVLQNKISLADLPPPDLFIRTSGEQRLSNFLLWQLAYTELYFTDILWPDFDGEAFESAIREFSSRQRRYGLTNAQVKAKKGNAREKLC